MNKNPFPPTSNVKEWTVARLTAVCTLTVDEDVSYTDIMELLVPALGEIGLIKSEDKIEVTKAGDTLVISKYRRYMEIETEDKRN